MAEPAHFVIVGGGTAGWLTAFIIEDSARRQKLDIRVSVVESSKIPTVGVGEGSTAAMRVLFQHFKIDEFEFFRETGATFKLGIRHTDWRRKGFTYYGPIDDPHQVVAAPSGAPSDYLNVYCVAAGRKVQDMHLFGPLLEQKKAPYAKKADGSLIALGPFHHAFHFDQARVGKFLKSKSKGVAIVDAVIEGVERDGESGDITALQLDTGERLEGDFFIDASGFRKRLIVKELNAPWISYQKELPVNRALPFWLDIQPGEEINNYTHAWAQEAGWIWQIPTQGRYGCGYVYSDEFKTPEEAKREVEATLGREIEVRDDIRFQIGRLENAWIGNCLAVGLSSSFLEPLESTSIHGTIVQMMLFTQRYLKLPQAMTAADRADYNRRVGRQVAGEDGRLGLAVEGLAADRLAGERRADDDGQRLAPLLHRALAGGAHRRHRQHIDGRAGKAGAACGPIRQPPHDRLQAVMAFVMEWVRLGRGDQDAVDPAREKVGEDAAAPRPETGEDLRQRTLEVGHGAGTGVQRLQGVDQHDLAVEPGDMLAEERLHHMRFVGLVAPLHGGCERARGKTSFAEAGQRREGQRRRAFQVAGHEKTARRQRGKRPVVGLAGSQIGGEALRQAARGHLVERRRRIDLCGFLPPFPGNIGAHRQLGEFEGVGREGAEILAEQRQVEKPFAGIVDDVDGELSRGEQPPPAGGGFVLDGEAEFGDGSGRIRPYALADEGCDMVLVLEARHGVVGLMFEKGAGDAAGFLGLEERQPAAMDEIVHESGDEDRLAGAGKARHAEPHRGRDEPGSAVGQRIERDERLVGEGSQRGHGPIPSVKSRPI